MSAGPSATTYSSYVFSLNKEDSVLYFSKLKQLGFSQEEDDPFLVDGSKLCEEWSRSKELWPEIIFVDIYACLIEHPSYSHKSLKAYKSLEAFQLSADGCVQEINVRQSQTGHSIIRAIIVDSSQDAPGSGDSHIAWVGFNNEDGIIVNGHCTCMASSAPLCAHAAAIMFRVGADIPHPRGEDIPRPGVKAEISSSDSNLHQMPTIVQGQVDCEVECADAALELESHEHTAKTTITVATISSRQPKAKITIPTATTSSPEPAAGLEMANVVTLTGDVSQITGVDEGSIQNHDPEETESASSITDVPEVAADDLEERLIAATKHKAVSDSGDETGLSSSLLKVKTESLINESRPYSLKPRRHKQWLPGSLLKDHETPPASSTKKRRAVNPTPLPGSLLKDHDTPPPASSTKRKRAVNPTPMPRSKAGVEALRKKPRLVIALTRLDPTKLEEMGTESPTVKKTRPGPRSRQRLALKSPKGHPVVDAPSKEKQHIEKNLLIKTEMQDLDPSEKPWKCNLCEMRFRVKSRLERHTMIHINSRPFKCDMCDFAFNRKFDLQIHERRHKNIRPYQCELCPTGFFVRSGLVIHTKTVHSTRQERPFKCQNCDNAFAYRYPLKVHMTKCPGLRKIPEFKYQCSECSEKFMLKKKFMQHMNTHTKTEKMKLIAQEKKEIIKKEFQCDTCGNICSTEKGLERHAQRHKRDTLFKCDKCEETFKFQVRLHRHIISQHGSDGIFKCPYCAKVYPDTDGLFLHMKRKLCLARYQCISCSVNFSTQPEMEAHVTEHAQVTPKGKKSLMYQKFYKCHKCDEEFRDTTGLYNHARTHSGEKPFQCNLCDRSFKYNSTLKRHIKFHSEKTFQCNRCERRFFFETSLQRHTRLRFCELRFKCSKCEKCFKTAKGLELHNKLHSDGQPLGCNKCWKEFSHQALLDYHMRNHERQEQKHHRCEVCGKEFRSLPSFELHIREHDGFKPFSCSVCKFSFRFRASLRNHMQKVHVGVKRYQCPHCVKKYFDSFHLNSHIVSAHLKERRFICDVCGHNFSTLGQLKRHIWTHKRERPFKCDICQKAFSFSNNMRRHRMVHTGEKPFICNYCGKGFTQKANLNAHIVQHTGEKLFECKECGKNFSSKKILGYHTMKHHEGESPDKGKPYKCSLCGQGFSYEGKLTLHMEWHKTTGQKQYQCSECDLQMSNWGEVVIHLQSAHSIGGQPQPIDYKGSTCNLCGKRYLSESYLINYHMKTHTGEKPFPCTFCDKRFISKYALKNHTASHTGDKRFTCKVCGDKFVACANLCRHMRIHTGEKPYKCNICGNQFRQPSGLYCHMRSHTGEKPFRCSDCGQAYSDKRNLLRHMKKHAPAPTIETDQLGQLVKFEVANTVG